MTKPLPKPDTGGDQEKLVHALATIIAGTRRVKRQVNLLQVAQAIETAQTLLGSRREVARAVDLSEEMLREFSMVTRLNKEVRKLVSKGQLSSVDVCYRLSMLPQGAQKCIAEEYIAGELSLRDVREVAALYKRKPALTLAQAVAKVKKARDVVHYIIRFRLADQRGSVSLLKRRFATLIGKANVVGLSRNGRIGTLTITAPGERKLRELAKQAGLSKRKFVLAILEE